MVWVKGAWLVDRLRPEVQPHGQQTCADIGVNHPHIQRSSAPRTCIILALLGWRGGRIVVWIDAERTGIHT